ncbi:hypothetical protein T4B_2198 [Trichinella pseudospiralis]|uniref:Uncharacterized protein n=1 Tax=Trichinella pseudospiralis TaxID=6337 RepID=A0A0V1GKL9_TRIPS|nr:hypothetical protein T4B_2198 [Trichinella pseudospiralis]
MCWDLRFMLRFAITFGISFWTKRQYCCFPIHSMPMKSRDIRFPGIDNKNGFLPEFDLCCCFEPNVLTES